ncbi:Transcription initiation factor IIF subunit beta [Yarrowia sp. C11]|nr:Transcription initiation factor IIF subunit beta [Yarrowia sp. C11]KAG5364364.1 Transcription initiation factor IIF subunit beta [Yarrowia sp. E02]
MNVKSEVKPEDEDVKIPLPPLDPEDGSFDLDTAGLENRVWLVRLPKFLVDKWSHLDEHTNKRLGQVLIKENTAPGEKQKVSLRLSDTPENSEIPHEYELDIVKEVVNNTFVFTEKEQKKDKDKDKAKEDTTSAASSSGAGKVTKPSAFPFARTIPKKTALAGRVIHECTVVPSLKDANYKKVIQKRKERLQQPPAARVTLLNDLPGVVASSNAPNLRGTGSQSHFMKAQKKDIKLDGKAVRIERSALLDILFKLFEEYPYWSLKGLKERTKQPEVYLREVLDSMAVLNKSGPYAMKYSLQQEYKQLSNSGAAQEEDEADDDDDDVEMETVL